MAKTPLPTELLDTDSLFPSLNAPDRLAILMQSEHLFQLLESYWVAKHSHLKLFRLDTKGSAVNYNMEELVGGGDLGTPSVMIKLCYLHGMIPETLYRKFEVLRWLRNKCAHSRVHIDFSNKDLSKGLGRLCELSGLKLPAEQMVTAMLQQEGGTPQELKISSSKMMLLKCCGKMAVETRAAFGDAPKNRRKA